MADQDRKTVKVLCTIPNGIELSLFKEGHDDGAGHRYQVRDGAPVVLRSTNLTAAGVQDHEGLIGTGPVENEVDAEFMEAWLEQNKKNPFVTDGVIRVVDEKPAAAK